MSSADIIIHSDPSLTSSLSVSITTANKKELRADPWFTFTPTFIHLWLQTLMITDSRQCVCVCLKDDSKLCDSNLGDSYWLQLLPVYMYETVWLAQLRTNLIRRSLLVKMTSFKPFPTSLHHHTSHPVLCEFVGYYLTPPLWLASLCNTWKRTWKLWVKKTLLNFW